MRDKERLNAYNREYYARTKARRLQQQHYYRKSRPEVYSSRLTRRKYGLSAEEIEEKKAQQEWACAICLEPSDRLCVDHCHDTGRIRGLLCNSCNLALGHMRDSISFLSNAVAYLQYYSNDE